MACTTPETVVVKDANIIIDIVNGDLLGAWVKLGIRTLTTDMVESELKKGSQWSDIKILIASGAINVESLSSDQIEDLFAIKRSRKVSLPDSSVLFLAKNTGAKLLTGDRKLKMAATKAGVQVHGLLWILDLLVLKKVITKRKACDGLRLIINNGARLPDEEVEKRLGAWQ